MLSIAINGKIVEKQNKNGSLKIKVDSKNSYVITDDQTHKSPEKLQIKQIKKDLQIFEEGSDQPSIILEDYYTQDSVSLLSGVTDSGSYVSYSSGSDGELILSSSISTTYISESTAIAIENGMSSAAYIAGGVATFVGGVAIASYGNEEHSTIVTSPTSIHNIINGTITAGPIISNIRVRPHLRKNL